MELSEINSLSIRTARYCQNRVSPRALLITACVLTIIGTLAMCNIPPFSSYLGFKAGLVLAITGAAVVSAAAYLHSSNERLAQYETYKLDDLSTSFKDLSPQLMRRASLLKDLDLSDCCLNWSENDKCDLLELVGKYLSLRSLNLSDCDLPARAMFWGAVMRSPRLLTLNMSGNPSMLGEILRAAENGLFHRLELLNLSRIGLNAQEDNISRLEKCLLQRLPRLKTLILRDNGLSEEDRNRLQAALPPSRGLTIDFGEN